MRNYVLHIDGVEHHVRAEDDFPCGRIVADSTLRTTKRRINRNGPNYDGTYNSILAAKLYEPVRYSTKIEILKLLLDYNTHWVRGRYLVMHYGTDALKRVRELRHDHGWPVEERPASKGTWDYRINLRYTIGRRTAAN